MPQLCHSYATAKPQLSHSYATVEPRQTTNLNVHEGEVHEHAFSHGAVLHADRAGVAERQQEIDDFDAYTPRLAHTPL